MSEKETEVFMVKIGQSVSQVLISADKSAQKRSAGTPDGAKGAEADVVTISAEGKKRHILGQVMASITDGGAYKRRIDR